MTFDLCQLLCFSVVADGTLTIRARSRKKKRKRGRTITCKERHFGSIERSFEVPESVAADKIEATFENGVLTVTLPRKADAQKRVKKIEVKAA